MPRLSAILSCTRDLEWAATSRVCLKFSFKQKFDQNLVWAHMPVLELTFFTCCFLKWWVSIQNVYSASKNLKIAGWDLPILVLLLFYTEVQGLYRYLLWQNSWLLNQLLSHFCGEFECSKVMFWSSAWTVLFTQTGCLVFLCTFLLQMCACCFCLLHPASVLGVAGSRAVGLLPTLACAGLHLHVPMLQLFGVLFIWLIPFMYFACRKRCPLFVREISLLAEPDWRSVRGLGVL